MNTFILITGAAVVILILIVFLTLVIIENNDLVQWLELSRNEVKHLRNSGDLYHELYRKKVNGMYYHNETNRLIPYEELTYLGEF